jgi:hypothetical protein
VTSLRRAALAFVSLFLVALPAPAQQPAEIRVGVGWLALPDEVTITPGERGAMMARCSGCAAKRLTGTVTFRAQSDLLREAAGTNLHGPVSVSGDYETSFPGRAPLRIHFPARIHALNGRIRMVLRIPLEDYVALALAGESAEVASEAALQAMAVAVRTYAVNQRGRHAKEGFDLCDATHCQLLRLDSAPSSQIRGGHRGRTAVVSRGACRVLLQRQLCRYYGGRRADLARA